MRQAMADPRLRKSKVEVHEGGLEAAVTILSNRASPNLIMLETTLEGDRLIEALDALAPVVAPETRVIIIGRSNDIGLYRRLVGLGISEYLFGEVTADELVRAVEGIFAGSEGETQGRSIAVFGTEGGVGTSTVAVNLACALARAYQEEVVLVDLDFAFGTDALALNLSPKQFVTEALAAPERLDDVLLERFMVKYDEHLSVLAAPMTPGQSMDPRPEAVDALLSLLRSSAAFVVLDVPHLWRPWVRETLLDANELLLVTYPDLANLRDSRNILDALGDGRGVHQPTRLVFNRVGLCKKAELSGKDFEESAKVEPQFSIPFEPVPFAQAMNNGEPLIQTASGSASAKMFEQMAWQVSGRDRPITKKKGKSLLSGLFKSGK